MPSGWKAAADEPTLEESIWRARRTVTLEHTLGASEPSFDGATAWGGVAEYRWPTQKTEYVYKKAATEPSVPTGGTDSETHKPSGWERSKPELTEPVWRAVRTLTYLHTRKSDGSGPDKEFQSATEWGGIRELLWVNPGGPYREQGRFHSSYVSYVHATASGGTPPYSYRWEGRSTDSRGTLYILGPPGYYKKSVTVTDAAGDTATATARIHINPPRGTSGASDDSAQDVPLGGTLTLIWGGEGSITAVSDDASVAAVSVSGAEIRVSGISSGRTEIAVTAGGNEFRLPVRVGGGE